MSFDPDFEAQIDELGSRAKLMDELCAANDRNPETLRKSANLFDAEARANGGRLRDYDDEALFNHLVRDLIAAGTIAPTSELDGSCNSDVGCATDPDLTVGLHDGGPAAGLVGPVGRREGPVTEKPLCN